MAEIGNPTFANEALSQRQSILATIGSIGSAFIFLADQAGVAVSIRPPPTITAVEIVATALIVAIVCFASTGYMETGLELGRATQGVCGARNRVQKEEAPPARS